MNSPYFYEETIRHRKEEMQRNELRAQLTAQVRAEQDSVSRFAGMRGLVARVSHPRQARGRREAYSH